ncbi:MAG: argininosuccinate synthase [Acidiferrobacterales bacterium]|nr:argininosuccinate synthase [Acidiferrobacterales bacterium]
MSKKIVLAYSGGLDTSVILRWLQDERGYEVVPFTADIGQNEDLDVVKEKATELGCKEIFVENLTEEFVRDYVYPMFRINALYEGEYLLGTSIARPLIAAHLVSIARKTGAEAIAHGATGKGNDQIRFELGAYAMMPDVKIVSPWREWEFQSREDLLQYAQQHGIAVDRRASGKADYSMDANILHISYEGGELEDPWAEPPADMWKWTRDLKHTPDEPQDVEIEFEAGDAVAVNGECGSPAAILSTLNDLGARHGIGRIDIVENRYIGMKSRGCYETPGGTILIKAHRAMESITMDREVAHLMHDLMPRYAKLVYNGLWWSAERVALQKLIDESQQYVSGKVRLRLYKGNVIVTGRKSEAHSMYDEAIVSFDDESGAYDQSDAEGFIKLNALRLRVAAARGRKL